MDETSDISRAEQVSICLSYLLGDERKESFLGFYVTKSTTGEALYDLLSKVMREFNLDMSNIIAECFDGASNMSGENKGLAARMKVTSPMSIYIHCYGHIINLALQSTLENVTLIRNTLGIIQSLYNFIEASPKRHAIFQDFDEGGEGDLLMSLKSQSITRWSCRWEAVKSVYLQLGRIVGCLIKLSEDKDSKTYTDARSLLNCMLNLDFIFGLCVLRVILMNTSNLNSYIQGKKMDIATLRKNANMTITTLKRCRTDDDFDNMWELTSKLSEKVQEVIRDTSFKFKDPSTKRSRKVSRRLQDLVGEERAETNTLQEQKDRYRIDTYFTSLDYVVSELESRFSENDFELLCNLSEVILNPSPKDECYDMVSSHYKIDKDLLIVEHNLFFSFIENTDISLETPGDVLRTMFENEQLNFLPHFSKAVRIFNIVPVTSCSAERSFSALRRLKTYLRSTMGQERLNNIAVLCIEREYGNKVLQYDIEKIIDKFASEKNRSKHFF